MTDVDRSFSRSQLGVPGAEEDAHGMGISSRIVAVLFALFAAYAALFALASHGAESDWGAWATGAYGAAAILAAWCWRRFPGIPVLAALVGAFLVPAVVLPNNLGPTSEVRVVARAASLWLAHGTPYLTSNQLVSWRSYDPYLPGMSIFGLPHAVGLPGALGDPLSWLALVAIVVLVAAFFVAAPDGARQCAPCRRQTVLAALLLLSTPVFAFPMALGVTDPPVIALMCLGLALAVRGAVPSPHFRPVLSVLSVTAADGEASGISGSETSPRRHGHALLAGLAIGLACALKATAWPALPVVFALIVVRDGGRAAGRFAISALGIFFALTALTAPKLLAQPKGLWQNLVEYPLGLSHRVTPAASPLPGHVLAEAGTLGHIAAIGLFGAAALLVGLSLIVWPLRDIAQASMRLAIGLAAMFILAPDTRFGYFTYPVGILAWLLLAVALPRFRGAHRAPYQHRIPWSSMWQRLQRL